jgi:hypothetical protein
VKPSSAISSALFTKHLKNGERVRIAGLGIAKSENAQLERLNGQRSNAGAAAASIWYLSSLLCAPKRAAARTAVASWSVVKIRVSPIAAVM